MGIPYYFTYIIKNHSNIINNLKNLKNVNELYLDSNSLIYESINFEKFENSMQFEKMLINSVIDKINTIVKLVKPTNFTYISFDGIPPFAKLNQQKNRRYKNHIQDILFNNEKLWDTAAITPGTKFMNKLDNELQKYYNNKNFILSLSNERGEGEHKIFKYIRNNKKDDNNILIYGMDADLIMLSLNHLKYCKNINLFRETPDFINNISKTYNTNERYYMNIPLLANEIYKIMLNKNIEKFITNNIVNDYSHLYNKISDYIFMCFMLGNDFIPHSPAINIRTNGLDILLELYKSLFNNHDFLTNIDTIKINWSNFKKFIYKIGENEELFIKNNYDLANKKTNFKTSTIEEKLYKYNCTPLWEKNIEHFINPHEKFWEFRYYYSIFNVNIDNDSKFIANISNHYLKILLWTFNYYCNDCINWTYFYDYSYPPLLMDLYKNIPYFESEITLEKNDIYVNPIITLSYVLPKNSLNLLPKNIQNYLIKTYQSNYNYDHKIIYPFCKYIWEGHVDYPKIDIFKFIDEINKLL